MTEVRKTPDKFEVWDGGHCFFRATKNFDPTTGKNYVILHRFPNRASLKDVIELGIWAEEST